MIFSKSYIIFVLFIYFSTPAILAVESDKSSQHHQPLYMVYTENKYITPDLVINESSLSSYRVTDSKQIVQLACPIKEDPNDALEVVKEGRDMMVFEDTCAEPIKHKIFKLKDTDKYIVGYLINKPDSGSLASSVYQNIPQDHVAFELLEVRFDKSNVRIIYISYHLSYTALLKARSNLLPMVSFDKNEDIYGFDIDDIYQKNNLAASTSFEDPQSNSTLRKVQLVPEADFLFDNHKKATRLNLLTTAMWEWVIAQWRDLENCIRDVARALNDDRIRIETGTSDAARSPQYLDRENSIRAWNYIWKTMSIRQCIRETCHNVGILFIMHNNIYDDVMFEKLLCEDVSSDNGWNFASRFRNRATPLYACSLSADTMKLFDIQLPDTYGEFDLNNLPKVVKNQQGNDELVHVNVLDEMRKLNMMI